VKSLLGSHSVLLLLVGTGDRSRRRQTPFQVLQTMTKAHLTRLWATLSLAAFAYIVGSVIVIQGGVDIFGAKLFVAAEKDGKPAIGYFAAIVGGVLLSAALAIAILHARRHGTAWHERLPVIGLEGLDTASREGKLYQSFFLIVLVIIPLYGIGRSLEVANRGGLCEQAKAAEQPRWYKGNEWRLVFLPERTNQLRLMREGENSGPCSGHGVEINWYTPILVIGAPALAVFLVGALFLTLWRRR
jgi:hypothetical protein